MMVIKEHITKNKTEEKIKTNFKNLKVTMQHLTKTLKKKNQKQTTPST